MQANCDQCDVELDGQRVLISTEATDDSGVDVEVAKRWTLCRSCADDVFEKVGESSPWEDNDFKTVVLPDEESIGVHAGGFANSI